MELPSEFAIPTAPAGIGDSIFEETPVPTQLETAEFRRTLGMFATGVTVITTRVGEQIHGMTANAFMSVSLQPPLILISVDRRAKMNALLREDARFGVSVLEESQSALSNRFAGREGDGSEAAFEIVNETPLVAGALAHLIAQVARSYWGGDHSLFLGRVEYARYGTGTPLVDAVRSVLELADVKVVDLDDELGGTKNADLLCSYGGRSRLVEVKSASRNAPERAYEDLVRHLREWEQLPGSAPVDGGALVLNHQHRMVPHERNPNPYNRPEFLTAQTEPVITTLALFDAWREDDVDGVRRLIFGDAQLRTPEPTGELGPARPKRGWFRPR